MKDIATIAQGPSQSSGVALRIIWSVEADEKYERNRPVAYRSSSDLHPSGGKGLICLRTLSGRGRVCFTDAEPVDVGAGTLLLMRWADVEKYYCRQATWKFWWVEFEAQTGARFPLGRVLPVALKASHRTQFRRLRRLLRSSILMERRLASALFDSLLCEWLCEWESSGADQRSRDALSRVVQAMHERLDGSLALREMARIAGKSERGLRDLFNRETGRSPKAFYDELRLSVASEYIRTGVCNVSEAAYRFGYSSPFHFSRAFKRHLGVSPSEIKP